MHWKSFWIKSSYKCKCNMSIYLVCSTWSNAARLIVVWLQSTVLQERFDSIRSHLLSIALMVLMGGLHCTLCSIDIHSNTCKCIRPETKACAKSFRNHTPISLRSGNSQNLDNNGKYSHPTSEVLFKHTKKWFRTTISLVLRSKVFLQKELCKSWVRLLQLLLPSSHEKWWVEAHSQFQASEPCAHEMPVKLWNRS